LRKKKLIPVFLQVLADLQDLLVLLDLRDLELIYI
jgi:hypothetical protein